MILSLKFAGRILPAVPLQIPKVEEETSALFQEYAEGRVESMCKCPWRDKEGFPMPAAVSA